MTAGLPLVLALAVVAPAAATAPRAAGHIAVEVVGRGPAQASLEATIDRASGAADLRLVTTVRYPGDERGYDRAEYVTDDGPVEQPLAHEPRGSGAGETVSLPITRERLEAFVAEGEPWRVTLEAQHGPSMPLLVPPGDIAGFLDELDRESAASPSTRGG